MENPLSPEKTSKEVLLDYAKEIVGYENGLLRTLIDLRKQPDVVLKGYLAKDLKYVSPFKLLISALSLWVLVNSFFLDWYEAWENLMFRMSGWIQSLIGPAKDQEKFEAVIAPIASLTGKLAGDLFSKYYVPFVLIVLPLTAFFSGRKCKQYGIDFRTLLAALAFSLGLNVLVMFFVSVFAYFDVFITFAVIGIPIVVMQLLGKGHLVMLLPLRKFFSQHGVEIEKKVSISMIISTLLIMLPGIAYYYYQIFLIINARP